MNIRTTEKFDSITKLYANTPIGKIEIPQWETDKVFSLSNEELLEKAIAENNHFCISPATFAMIERRFLTWELQQKLNPQPKISPFEAFLNNLIH